MGAQTVNRKIRSSNIEILRILCILAIIADHFIGQSGITEFSSFSAALFYYGASSLSRVACSVFVIISAWFSADNDFKFSRVIHTWLTVVMYTVPLTIVMMCMGMADKNNLVAAFLPVSRGPLWFAGCYIIIVLLSPALNMLINKAPRKILTWILTVLFVLLSLYSTIMVSNGYLVHDTWVMIYIYLLTGYFKHYGFPERIGSFLSKPLNCLIVFFIFWLPMVFFRSLGDYSTSSLYILRVARDYADCFRAQLQSVPNMVMAYSIFFCFKSVNVKPSRIINFLASTTLGVYCFHQVPVWYGFLWKQIMTVPVNADALHGWRRALYAIFAIVLIWVLGTVAEIIRNQISLFLFEKRNFTTSLCKKIDSAVNGEQTSEINTKALITVTAVFFIVLRIMSMEHYWYLPLTADRDLISSNEVTFILSGDLLIQGECVEGSVHVKNTGSAIESMSTGKYPIYLGISVVDDEGNEIDRDYIHLPIMKEGVLNSDKSVDVAVSLDDKIDEYFISGDYRIRAEIVQEGIGWEEDSAVFFDL